MGSGASVSSTDTNKQEAVQKTKAQDLRLKQDKHPPVTSQKRGNTSPRLARRSTAVSIVDTGSDKTLVSVPDFNDDDNASGYSVKNMTQINYNDPMYDRNFGFDAEAGASGGTVPRLLWQQGKQRSSISFTTKGLQNAPGANNCFLNSAVQVGHPPSSIKFLGHSVTIIIVTKTIEKNSFRIGKSGHDEHRPTCSCVLPNCPKKLVLNESVLLFF